MPRLGFMSSMAGLALLLSCSGGSGPGNTAGVTPSNLSVHLVGAPGDGVQSLNLAIQKVEVGGPGGWVTVASPNAAFPVATLVDGASASLAAGGSLPVGAYTSLRLSLGTGSTAQLVGGGVMTLAPVAQLFVVPISLVVGSAPVDLTLIVDPGRSVQPRGSALVLAPELRAVDRNASGSITGTFTDSSNQPLAGALVTAQYFQAFGEPVVLRRALTRADGGYQLDLLPFGTACYAVCFPQTASRVFEPRASAAFTPQPGAASFTFNAGFNQRNDLGSTSGTVTPVTNAAQGDEITLVFGAIMAGGAPESFIIGSSPGILGGSIETWAFTRLPAGSTYQLRAVRRTWSADGTCTIVRKFSEDYGFLAGLDFSYGFFF